MKIDAGKVIKIAVSVASIGLTLVTNYLAEKNLDEKVAKKVAEALENK